MAQKYTLIAEQNFSGKKPIKIGDEITDLTAVQVSRYLKRGSAKFKTKKEQETFVLAFEAEEKQRLADEAQAKALLHKEALTNELTLIYTDAVKKEAEIKGVVRTEAEILANVEALLKRV